MHEQKLVPAAIAVAMILSIQGEMFADPSGENRVRLAYQLRKPEGAPVVLTVYSDYV